LSRLRVKAVNHSSWLELPGAWIPVWKLSDVFALNRATWRPNLNAAQYKNGEFTPANLHSVPGKDAIIP
jgi:hypothetical protein